MAELQARLADEPDDAGLHLRLGRLLYGVSRIEDAIPALQRAVSQAEHEAAARLLLAQCYLRTNAVKLAVQELHQAQETAREGSDDWKDATYLLGRVFEGAGRKERALGEYEKIAGGRGREGSGALAPLGPTDPPRVPPAPFGHLAEVDGETSGSSG